MKTLTKATEEQVRDIAIDIWKQDTSMVEYVIKRYDYYITSDNLFVEIEKASNITMTTTIYYDDETTHPIVDLDLFLSENNHHCNSAKYFKNILDNQEETFVFAGVGAQAKSLTRLGWEFEHYRAIEFNKYSITVYNAIHGTDFMPSDITKLKGGDLGISECDKYEYILTYSFP